MSEQQSLPFASEPARDEGELLSSGLAVLDQAFAAGATEMLPLFSGGHDSLCACHVAAQHPRFPGAVYHIDTGIGAQATRAFVDEVCREYGWELKVYKSASTYEKFIREMGFPGPGAHHWIYARIKERCVRRIMHGPAPRALVTGCRRAESTRRMGHVEAIKIGETSKRTGKVTERKRIWAAPCHDWTGEEQRAYMLAHDLPRNPVKDSPLGMSGECFCGAFARPGELGMIRAIVPDVAAEIDRLQVIARECGRNACEWGKRAPGERGIVAVQSGALCSTCDRKAAAAGVLFEYVASETEATS